MICKFDEYLENDGIPYKSFGQLVKSCKCDWCMNYKNMIKNIKDRERRFNEDESKM